MINEPDDIGLLDGFTFCGECKQPIFYDGKKYYRHVQDLPQSRLRKLMKVQRFAEQVYSWLITLSFVCPECGEKPNPFLWEMDKETFYNHVSNREGARDLWLCLQGVDREEQP